MGYQGIINEASARVKDIVSFDIKRQSDNTYALMGDVEILINSTYIGMLDKNMNYIPPEMW